MVHQFVQHLAVLAEQQDSGQAADSKEPAEQQQTGASAAQSIISDSMVEINLKHILRQNWKKIQSQFASYMSCLCKRVEQTGVSVEDFRFHLINLPAFKSEEKKDVCKLFAHAKLQLEKANSINEMFYILSEECTSFLNCEIFLYLQRKYDIPNDCEDLNYSKHLQDYVNKHKISEFFQFNPKLQENISGCEKIRIKFNVSTASKLDKLLNLQDRISAILDVMPGALQLISVEEGCVIMTFLVSTQLAQIIFINEEFTAQEIQEFQALSVLWLEYNHRRFKFETRRKGKVAIHIL